MLFVRRRTAHTRSNTSPVNHLAASQTHTPTSCIMIICMATVQPPALVSLRHAEGHEYPVLAGFKPTDALPEEISIEFHMQ
jgi:hypothetical protein